jgi:hypothetical protein
MRTNDDLIPMSNKNEQQKTSQKTTQKTDRSLFVFHSHPKFGLLEIPFREKELPHAREGEGKVGPSVRRW